MSAESTLKPARSWLKRIIDAGVHDKDMTGLDIKHVRATNIVALIGGLAMLGWVPLSFAAQEFWNGIFNVAVVILYSLCILLNHRTEHFKAAIACNMTAYGTLVCATLLHGVPSATPLFFFVSLFIPFLMFPREHRRLAYVFSLLSALTLVLAAIFMEHFPRTMILVDPHQQVVMNTAFVAVGTFVIAYVFIRTIEENEDRLHDEKLKQERLNQQLHEEKRAQELLNDELEREKATQIALNQELREANEAKSRFLAGVSHELRTPMNAIIGFTRIVKRKGKEVLPKRQLENLDKVLISSEHLLTLINDILDLSKIEAGQMGVELQTLVVQNVVREAIETSRTLLREGVTMQHDIDDTMAPIHSDPHRVKQVVLNLLSNAAKFTHEGTVTLTLSLADDDEHIALSVKDTGIGISSEAIERIFEEFQQADTSTTREYGGTGLGLPISRSLAQLLGGALTVESVEGEGSTFTLTLPRHSSEG